MKKEEEEYKISSTRLCPHTPLVSTVFPLVSIVHCVSANKSSSAEGSAGPLPSGLPSPGVVAMKHAQAAFS